MYNEVLNDWNQLFKKIIIEYKITTQMMTKNVIFLFFVIFIELSHFINIKLTIKLKKKNIKDIQKIIKKSFTEFEKLKNIKFQNFGLVVKPQISFNIWYITHVK